MKKNLIIFDLDGTLLNTLEDLTDSVNYSLKNFDYPQQPIHNVRNYIGNGVAKLIERSIPEGKSNKNYEQVLEIFKQHYSKNMFNKTSPYPQIMEMLEILKLRNYKTGVVSNKFDSAVKNLCNIYFGELIDLAIGENELYGIKKKPNPDTVFSLIDELSEDIQNAIYVGDSDVDILTAKNSGLPCISVSWGYRDKKFLINSGAKIIIDNPLEIMYYLD